MRIKKTQTRLVDRAVGVCYYSIMCLRILLLAVIAGFSGLAADRPAVVVLAPFKHGGSDVLYQDWWQNITPLHEQVAGELARNYNCVVLSRSFGHALSEEDAVKRLGAIDDTDFAPEELAGADYSFTGIFVPEGKSVVLRMVDLRSASAEWEDKVTSVSVPGFEGSAAQVAQGIAEAASIPKRAAPRAVDSGRRTWMVLPPVVTAQVLPGKRDETAAALQMMAEVALQKEEARVRLVDRTALEAVLKEHAIGGLRNEAHLRKISRLVGAERALIVLAGNTGQRDEVQVDVLALDVARTEVLGSVMRRCGKGDVLKAVEESVAACVSALGVPSALASATPAQRAREARLHLETAKYNFAYTSARVSLLVMEYAEVVYLLARDNPEVMRETTSLVAERSIYWAAMQKNQRILVKGEVSRFLRRALGQHPDLGTGDDGTRAYQLAQAFSADEDYASARRVAEDALQANPRETLVSPLRRVLAECHYADGDYRRALECLKDGDGGRTRLARVKIAHALKDEDAEFAAMREVSSHDYFISSYYFANPREMGGGISNNLWFRHLALLDKREGPAAVCEFIEAGMNRYPGYPQDHIKYELAKYYAKAGDKKKAAEIAHVLLAQGTWMGWQLKDADFRKLLEELIAEVGDAAEAPVWKKARELREIPEAFAFYIQPVGEVRPHLLEAVRAGVEDFFGAKAILLPKFELSKDAPYYIKASNRYQCDPLAEDVKRQMKLPSNALSAVMVMEDDLADLTGKNSTWSYRNKWFTLVATAKPWAKENQQQEKAIRNLVIQLISTASWGVGHGQIPCITSQMRNTFVIANAKFAYSPKAQDLYMKVDFEAKNRAMIELFREAGATIIEPPHGQ